MNLDELTHDEKVAIYVTGLLDELRELGMVEGGFRLMENGMHSFAALTAAGFQPTEAECVSMLRVMQAELAARDSIESN